jgi:hypothetical protein
MYALTVVIDSGGYKCNGVYNLITDEWEKEIPVVLTRRWGLEVDGSTLFREYSSAVNEIKCWLEDLEEDGETDQFIPMNYHDLKVKVAALMYLEDVVVANIRKSVVNVIH